MSAVWCASLFVKLFGKVFRCFFRDVLRCFRCVDMLWSNLGAILDAFGHCFSILCCTLQTDIFSRYFGVGVPGSHSHDFRNLSWGPRGAVLECKMRPKESCRADVDQMWPRCAKRLISPKLDTPPRVPPN